MQNITILQKICTMLYQKMVLLAGCKNKCTISPNLGICICILWCNFMLKLFINFISSKSTTPFGLQSGVFYNVETRRNRKRITWIWNQSKGFEIIKRIKHLKWKGLSTLENEMTIRWVQYLPCITEKSNT